MGCRNSKVAPNSAQRAQQPVPQEKQVPRPVEEQQLQEPSQTESQRQLPASGNGDNDANSHAEQEEAPRDRQRRMSIRKEIEDAPKLHLQASDFVDLSRVVTAAISFRWITPTLFLREVLELARKQQEAVSLPRLETDDTVVISLEENSSDSLNAPVWRDVKNELPERVGGKRLILLPASGATSSDSAGAIAIHLHSQLEALKTALPGPKEVLVLEGGLWSFVRDKRYSWSLVPFCTNYTSLVTRAVEQGLTDPGLDNTLLVDLADSLLDDAAHFPYDLFVVVPAATEPSPPDAESPKQEAFAIRSRPKPLLFARHAHKGAAVWCSSAAGVNMPSLKPSAVPRKMAIDSAYLSSIEIDDVVLLSCLHAVVVKSPANAKRSIDWKCFSPASVGAEFWSLALPEQHELLMRATSAINTSFVAGRRVVLAADDISVSEVACVWWLMCCGFTVEEAEERVVSLNEKQRRLLVTLRTEAATDAGAAAVAAIRKQQLAAVC